MAHSVTLGPLAGSCTTKPKWPVSLSLTVRYILNKGINMETFKSTVFSPILSTSATESRPAGWAVQAIWQKTPWSLQGEEFEAEYWTTCTVFQGAESFGPLHSPISCCVFPPDPGFWPPRVGSPLNHAHCQQLFSGSVQQRVSVLKESCTCQTQTQQLKHHSLDLEKAHNNFCVYFRFRMNAKPYVCYITNDLPSPLQS